MRATHNIGCKLNQDILKYRRNSSSSSSRRKKDLADKSKGKLKLMQICLDDFLKSSSFFIAKYGIK